MYLPLAPVRTSPCPILKWLVQASKMDSTQHSAEASYLAPKAVRLRDFILKKVVS
jgi:hypothetical protein